MNADLIAALADAMHLGMTGNPGTGDRPELWLASAKRTATAFLADPRTAAALARGLDRHYGLRRLPMTTDAVGEAAAILAALLEPTDE